MESWGPPEGPTMLDIESLTWLPTTTMRSPHVEVKGPINCGPAHLSSLRTSGASCSGLTGLLLVLQADQAQAHLPSFAQRCLCLECSFPLPAPSPRLVSLLAEILFIFESTNSTVSFVKPFLSRG